MPATLVHSDSENQSKQSQCHSDTRWFLCIGPLPELGSDRLCRGVFLLPMLIILFEGRAFDVLCNALNRLNNVVSGVCHWNCVRHLSFPGMKDFS